MTIDQIEVIPDYDDQDEFEADLAYLQSLSNAIIAFGVVNGSQLSRGPSIFERLRADMSLAANRAVFREWPA